MPILGGSMESTLTDQDPGPFVQSPPRVLLCSCWPSAQLFSVGITAAWTTVPEALSQQAFEGMSNRSAGLLSLPSSKEDLQCQEN